MFLQTKTETTHAIQSQIFLPCGPFAVYCGRDTQQVPFLSFYLCCCANIIILTVNLEKWSTVWWGWEDQWAKFSFLQIAALELCSCRVRLCVPVSWRQPHCWGGTAQCPRHIRCQAPGCYHSCGKLCSWAFPLLPEARFQIRVHDFAYNLSFFSIPHKLPLISSGLTAKSIFCHINMSFDSPSSPSVFVLAKDLNPFILFEND